MTVRPDRRRARVRASVRRIVDTALRELDHGVAEVGVGTIIEPGRAADGPPDQGLARTYGHLREAAEAAAEQARRRGFTAEVIERTSRGVDRDPSGEGDAEAYDVTEVVVRLARPDAP